MFKEFDFRLSFQSVGWIFIIILIQYNGLPIVCVKYLALHIWFDFNSYFVVFESVSYYVIIKYRMYIMFHYNRVPHIMSYSCMYQVSSWSNARVNEFPRALDVIFVMFFANVKFNRNEASDVGMRVVWFQKNYFLLRIM